MTLAEIVFLLLAGLLLAQSLYSFLSGYRFFAYVRRSFEKPPGNHALPAAVIIPCKDWRPDFDTNLSKFLAQVYPRYQAIFVVASEKDPAYNALVARLNDESKAREPGVRKASLVVAGYSEIRGEKVNNLIQGLAAVDPGAEVLVFADIDARPDSHWLRSLVSPLEDSSVMVSTGFRWYLPGASFVSRLRAAWDTSIATLLGDHNSNFAWGGSMALRAADFKRLQITERHWARTVSDDYAVTRAVREARGKIRFEPRCLLASREDANFLEFLRWANRQIIITRVYAPHLWWLGLATHGLYCATLLMGLALLALPSATTLGRLGIAGLLLGIVSLGLAKGCIRTRVAHEIFPEENELVASYGSCYWQLAPLVPWVMLLNFLVAAVARRIEWSGTVYELASRDMVRVLRRKL